MKALLVNPALHDTFYSYHKLVQIMGKKAIGPPLGLITVASLLPSEWDLKLVDLNFAEITERDWYESDVVLVTGTALQEKQIREVIRDAKARGKPVVVGGPWAFHCPEAALREGADLVVQGEAELLIGEILRKLDQKEFGGAIRAHRQVDMHEVPPARFDLLDRQNYWSMTIQFSRGCPYKCEYCDVTHMFGRRFRAKNPRQILQELDHLYRLGWRGSVFFVDDSFTGIHLHTKALLKELIPWMESRGFPFDFRTQAVASLAEDDELLELLVRSGFVSVYVGIDSTDTDTLEYTKKFHHAAMDLDSAVQKMNRAGLAVFAGFMIGFDHETQGVDRRVIDFVRRNNIPEVLVSPLMALPGTELWRRLESEGRLFSDSGDLAKQNRIHNFMPNRPEPEIAREMINIYKELYEPEPFLRRAYAHISRMNPRNYRKSLRFPSLNELRALLTILVKHGLVFPSRRTFRNLLARTVLKHRDRLGLFLHYSYFIREFFDFRNTGVQECLDHEFSQPLRETLFQAMDYSLGSASTAEGPGPGRDSTN